MSGDNIAAFKTQPKGFATKAIHVGQDPEQWSSMAVIAPIVTSTTFKQEAPAKHKVTTHSSGSVQIDESPNIRPCKTDSKLFNYELKQR